MRNANLCEVSLRWRNYSKKSELYRNIFNNFILTLLYVVNVEHLNDFVNRKSSVFGISLEFFVLCII